MKRSLIIAVVSFVVVLAACAPAPPPPKAPAPVPPTTTSVPAPVKPPTRNPGVTPIMGKSLYTAAELTAWYNSTGRKQAANSCATVPELARLYIAEGAHEGVRGDLAFIQAMLETGWLKHSDRVPASWCNYAGIGAVDSGTGANQFENATIGVRAQIHHLRAYADKKATCRNFKYPNASPRCHLVSPKGKSPTWEQMGGGNWATDTGYSEKILGLYAQLRKFVGR